jgi:solute carrier family 39 (zinc transporter), member 1/2/3
LCSSVEKTHALTCRIVIGLTLVVSGDSFFITLFIVILFHQVFEGMALGTRIATIGTHAHSLEHAHSGGSHSSSPDDADKTIQQSAAGADDSTSTDSAISTGLSMRKKLGLAALFAFVTPIGMAIGIGVLKHFNGNDKSTLVAIGTLDALSAGILVWVGVVEMWAGDWMTGSHGHKAELADADLLTVAIAGFGLVSGLVVMSVLGIWA